CPHQQPAKEAQPRTWRRADQSGARQRICVRDPLRNEMTIRIQSLFLKIFLWFWATVIATGIALIATWIILQPKNAPFSSQTSVAETAWIAGTAAVNEFEQHG